MLKFFRPDWNRRLHRAIVRRNAAAIETALRAGASPAAAGPTGELPLHAAVRHGCPPLVIAMLVKAGADVMASVNGSTAIEMALRHDNLPLLHTLTALVAGA